MEKKSKAYLQSVSVSPAESLEDVMRVLNKTRIGAAFVVDDHSRLVGVITDGDIRRAVLANTSLKTPVSQLLPSLAKAAHPQPFVMPLESDSKAILANMLKYDLKQVPLIDAGGRMVDLQLREELLTEGEEPIKAVLMAGGFGKRLMPVTEQIPKPMVQVGDRPLLHRIVTQLSEMGITDIKIATHHKHDVIFEYFGNGAKFGVDIEYVREDVPMGTAGALSRVPHQNVPILVMNGDILTDLNFRAMFDFHRSHDAVMTVGARIYSVDVPYGVLQMDGSEVLGIREKPQLSYPVNGGIYLIEPSALEFIPDDRPFHMTDLAEALIAQGKRVIAFPITEYWKDIGRLDDLEQARADLKHRAL